jgi:hypothetical protein
MLPLMMLLLLLQVFQDVLGIKNSTKSDKSDVLLLLLLLLQVFQDVLGIENFTKSDEAFAADALFLAYQSGSAEKVQAVVQVRL